MIYRWIEIVLYVSITAYGIVSNYSLQKETVKTSTSLLVSTTTTCKEDIEHFDKPISNSETA